MATSVPDSPRSGSHNFQKTADAFLSGERLPFADVKLEELQHEQQRSKTIQGPFSLHRFNRLSCIGSALSSRLAHFRLERLAGAA